MKGILQPISIRCYGLFDENGDRVFHFNIDNPKERSKINHLWGKNIDFEKNILSVVSEGSTTNFGPDVPPLKPVGKPKEKVTEEKKK